MIGQTISHYRITEKLGGGGMGVVYKAQDLKLDRAVALKFLPPELTLDVEAKERFIHEAKAASSLDHANICTVYDVDESADGQMFIAMACYDGQTLKERIAKGKLRIEEATGIGIQIAQGLAKAHEGGIVHRDIKPANIMITKDGVAKIVDFGLAKLSSATKITKTGSTLGTVAYMAPEQLQGSEVDARADIFSLGVVVYEMLTGRTPFRGDHEAALMYAIMNEEPEPLQTHIPDVSSELIHIVSRALEKDPASRYKTMDDLLIDLQRVRKETSKVSMLGYGRKRQSFFKSRRFVLPLLAVAISGIAITVFFVISNRAPKLNPNRTERVLDIPYRSIAFPGISQDGQWVAFGARDSDTTFSVFWMNIAKGQPRRLATRSRGIASAEISPDASEVLFTVEERGGASLYIVPTSEGPERKIAGGGIAGPQWRPDGKLIGYIRPPTRVSLVQTFRTVQPDGSNDRSVFADSIRGESGVFAFCWSPDGQSIAWLRNFEGENSEIFIRHLETGAERQLTSMKVRIDEVSWANNGQILFSSDKSGNRDIWAISERGGDVQQITRGPGEDYPSRISADSRRLVYRQEQTISHLWTAGVDGQNARQLTVDDQLFAEPSFSPDAKRIVFTSGLGDPFWSERHIFMMQSDWSGRTQLTSGNTTDRNPSWSPDGAMIAYASHPRHSTDDTTRIYWLDATALSTPHLIGKGHSVKWVGTRKVEILYTPFRGRLRYIASLEGGTVVTAAAADSTTEFELPDGINALVQDRRNASRGWWLTKVGSAQAASAKLLVFPGDIFQWSVFPGIDLKHVLYIRRNWEVWRVSIPAGKHERLDVLPQLFRRDDVQFQLSADGVKAVYAKQETKSKLVLMENVFE